MPPSLDDLDRSVLIVFHYGLSATTTDLLIDEHDPMIALLKEEGFQISKSRNSKRINVYLKDEADLQKVSKITDYPHFLTCDNRFKEKV